MGRVLIISAFSRLSAFSCAAKHGAAISIFKFEINFVIVTGKTVLQMKNKRGDTRTEQNEN